MKNKNKKKHKIIISGVEFEVDEKSAVEFRKLEQQKIRKDWAANNLID